jgi:hypothetical protein
MMVVSLLKFAKKLLLFSHKNAQQELNKAKHKKVKPRKCNLHNV